MVQFTDAGFGGAVKQHVDRLHTEWLQKGSNLAKWSGTGGSSMEMWEKGVLDTKLVADAYDKVCTLWYYEKMGIDWA